MTKPDKDAPQTEQSEKKIKLEKETLKDLSEKPEEGDQVKGGTRPAAADMGEEAPGAIRSR